MKFSHDGRGFPRNWLLAYVEVTIPHRNKLFRSVNILNIERHSPQSRFDINESINDDNASIGFPVSDMKGRLSTVRNSQINLQYLQISKQLLMETVLFSFKLVLQNMLVHLLIAGRRFFSEINLRQYHSIDFLASFFRDLKVSMPFLFVIRSPINSPFEIVIEISFWWKSMNNCMILNILFSNIIMRILHRHGSLISW